MFVKHLSSQTNKKAFSISLTSHHNFEAAKFGKEKGVSEGIHPLSPAPACVSPETKFFCKKKQRLSVQIERAMRIAPAEVLAIFKFSHC